MMPGRSVHITPPSIQGVRVLWGTPRKIGLGRAAHFPKSFVYRSFPSSRVPLFQNESKCEIFPDENEFCMQFHFHANQSHFHKNGFVHDSL